MDPTLWIEGNRDATNNLLANCKVFSCRNSDLGKKIVLQCLDDDMMSILQVHVEIVVAHSKKNVQYCQ